jgi:Ca2+-binding EF-hand superfamily protein
MNRLWVALVGLSLWGLVGAAAHAGDNDTPKRNPPPAIAALLQGSAEDFIKRFDKNNDGVLSKNELPPGLAQAFDRFDKNGDGKLDKEEVERMLQAFRQRFGVEAGGAAKGQPAKKNAANNPDPDAMVNRWLRQMDTNNDGKISREEARGPLKERFDQIDTNKDGFLDKTELQRVARRISETRRNGPNGPGAAPARTGPDFDDLDRDADGRLTRAELKGTPYESKFDEIDTNKDGKIDRKEFEAYLKKQAEKQETADKKRNQANKN